MWLHKPGTTLNNKCYCEHGIVGEFGGKIFMKLAYVIHTFKGNFHELSRALSPINFNATVIFV